MFCLITIVVLNFMTPWGGILPCLAQYLPHFPSLASLGQVSKCTSLQTVQESLDLAHTWALAPDQGAQDQTGAEEGEQNIWGAMSHPR